MRREIRMGLVALAVVAAGVGTAVHIGRTQDVAGSLPDSMRDLRGAREVELRDEAGHVVLRGAFAQVAGEAEVKAALTGSAGQGEAEIEVENESGSRRTELEVDVQGLAPRKVYTIHVDGQRAGELRTDADGKGEVELSATGDAK